MNVFPEQAHHPLRAIRRAILEGKSEKTVNVFRHKAATEVAALNGWYVDNGQRTYCPHDLSAVPQPWCCLCVGIPQRIEFLDYCGELAAIGSQPYDSRDGELRELSEHLPFQSILLRHHLGASTTRELVAFQ